MLVLQIVQQLMPDWLCLADNDRIRVQLGFIRHSTYMKSSQDYFRPGVSIAVGKFVSLVHLRGKGRDGPE